MVLKAQLYQRCSPAFPAIVGTVRVWPAQIAIGCDATALTALLKVARHADAPVAIILIAAAWLTRSRQAMWLITTLAARGGASPPI